MLSDESILEADLDENMLFHKFICQIPITPTLDAQRFSTSVDTSLSTMSASSKADANGDHNPHSPQLSELLFVSSTVLQQALDLVDHVLTDSSQLTVQSKYLPGSTIGKHLRHARDHFILLIDCVVGRQPYILSYDVRNRNTPMESSLSEAHDALISAISRLKELDTSPLVALDQTIILNAVTPFTHTFETTFGRELWFAALHAVHHWSMVRVIAGELDVFLPDDFGFAPSTLVYRGSDAPLGKAKI